MQMDPTLREALQRELEEATKNRADLDAVIRYLRGRLGLTEETEAVSEGRQPIPAGADPAAFVSPNQFFNQSAPRAAKALLERIGRERPLKTDEIFAALKKGGVKVSS